MAKELASSIQLTISGTLTNALDLTTPEDALSRTFRDTLATGDAIDLANRMWHDTRSAAAGVDDIDLGGGVTDGLGEVLTFTKIKCIAIFNHSVVVGETLTIGAAAAFPLGAYVGDAATDKIVIGPGGCMVLWNPCAAGYACGAGASDVLRVDPGAATISYDIIIIGTSA